MGMLASPRFSARHCPTRRGGAAQGCLIALAVVIVLLIGLGVFVYLNWKGWAASGIRAASEEVVAKSSLVQEDKDKINQKIASVTKDFEDGKISLDQVGRIAEALATGPLIPLASVAGIEKEYFPVAKFTDEEAAAAKRALERCARGFAEKKIPQTRINDILATISTTQPNGQFQLKPKEQVTGADVRKLVENALKEANDAQIPDEPFTVDIAKEVCDSIDGVLNPTAP